MSKKKMITRRARRALFFGVTVMCSAVVLPLSQAASTTPWSPTWTLASLTFATLGFLAVGVVPWSVAAPLRRLHREQQLHARPDVVVSIVEVSFGDAQPESPGVLVADEERISLLGMKGNDLTIQWREVESFAMAGSSIETIRMTTSGPHESVYLTLLKPNGIQSLPGWQLANQLENIKRLHHRSKNAA